MPKEDLPDVVKAMLDEPDENVLAHYVGYFLTPERIEALEAALLEYEQAEIPVKHHFGPGVYMREITMPRGAIAIGHAHKHDCLNIVLNGSASVLIDGEVKRITAPMVMVGKAMERKVGIVHEPLTWITVHATSETNPQKLEEDLLVKSEAFQAFERRLKDGCVARKMLSDAGESMDLDHADFLLAIGELGFTEEQVREASERTEDVIPVFDANRVTIGQSKIHGVGVFAARPFGPGEEISIARINGKRSLVGRYTNHAATPNAEMKVDGNIIALVATAEVSRGDELTVDYRKARQAAVEADQLPTT
jgi:hypothetical protein